MDAIYPFYYPVYTGTYHPPLTTYTYPSYSYPSSYHQPSYLLPPYYQPPSIKIPGTEIYKPEIYKPEEYHPSISSEKKKKVYRSAYIISVIKKDSFIKYGARLLTTVPFVYYIPKVYTGDSEHETCALLGIRVCDWTDLLTDDSLLIRNLRNSKELKYIQDIHKITSYHMMESVSKFKNDLKQFNDDDLILLNIEPKGNDHLEKSYPVPRLCIPGGGMERKDMNSFESCAFREYKEETGIDISNIHILIRQDHIYKKRSREKYNYVESPSPTKSYYTNYYNNHFIQKKDLRKSQENKQYMSIIYLVKIVSEEEKMLYDLETGQLSILPPPGMFFN